MSCASDLLSYTARARVLIVRATPQRTGIYPGRSEGRYLGVCGEQPHNCLWEPIVNSSAVRAFFPIDDLPLPRNQRESRPSDVRFKGSECSLADSAPSRVAHPREVNTNTWVGVFISHLESSVICNYLIRVSTGDAGMLRSRHRGIPSGVAGGRDQRIRPAMKPRSDAQRAG